MAVIRILLGVTFLSNGLAKLFDLHRIEIGPYVANLINRGDAAPMPMQPRQRATSAGPIRGMAAMRPAMAPTAPARSVAAWLPGARSPRRAAESARVIKIRPR
jgi:uncharacterized membrane protein YphA (DoxX/SURF4 family)